MVKVRFLSFKQRRRAIAMIELIFAIAVIGIVMMSLPQIIRVSAQSTYTTIQQESVAEVASTLSLMMTKNWDENAKGGVVGTQSPNIPSCTPPRPVGVTAGSGRPCLDANASTVLGLDGEPANSPIDYDDVDDFIIGSRIVSVPANENSYQTWQGDVIDKDINVSVTVSYGNDAAPGTTNYPNPFDGNLPAGVSTTNIKLLSVRLRSANIAQEINTKDIRLSAFMCNIGEPKFIKTKVVP